MKKTTNTHRSRRPMAAVDLFSGCGGLTLGLRSAGFTVRAAVEIEPKARRTYALNHPTVRLYEQDIRTLSARTLLRDLTLKPGQLDLLAGCPPCQGFSRLRTRNRAASVRDPRNDLVDEFLRFVRVLRPKAVMLENVPSLSTDRRFARLRSVLTSLGYQHTFAVLDAADYGVPQRRKRLILVGSRLHSVAVAEASGRRRTVRAALRGLRHPSRTADRLHAMPESRSPRVRALIRRIPRDGGSRSDLPREYRLACHGRSDGFHDVYGRMAWDEVAPTITSGCINPSKGRFLHPTEHRTITLREAAVLQGFPRRYKFDPSHGKEAIALMIGNALPPPFVAAHARALRRGIEPLTAARRRAPSATFSGTNNSRRSFNARPRKRTRETS